MLGQTFDVSDIPRLIALIFIEVFLSADNALILAAVVQPLPIALRRKALYIGSASAFVLRGLLIEIAAFMLKYLWLQLIGAAYLFYLCIQHFFFTKNVEETKKRPIRPFWKTVVSIELLDITFAMDSVIAGIAFIVTPSTETTTFLNPKIWIVYIGGIIGLLAIRYAAGHFTRLMDKFPKLIDSAFLLVAWVGIKLTLTILAPPIPHFEPLFWIVFILLFFSGFLRKRN